MSSQVSHHQLEEAKKEIYERLKKYVARSPYDFNPDKKKVDEIISGLAMRKLKFGRFYCPCRVLTGEEKDDRPKVCPCIWHRQEIEEKGSCYCGLFVKK